MARTSFLSEGDDPIVQRRHEVTADKAAHEPIRPADQAPEERHPVSDEELTQEGEVRTHHDAAFEHEPIGGDEDGEPDDNAGHDALDCGIQAQQVSEHDLLKSLFRRYHARLP